jgi:Cu/Zn superoxide dismutase
MKKAYGYGKVLFNMALAIGGAALVAGCGGGGEVVATTQGAWTVYTDVVTDNPAKDIKGSVEARVAGDTTVFTINVTGLKPSTPFGSHLHKLPCSDPTKAGGHYQHNAAPMDQASTPMYANTTNEVWLDFTTDAAGVATNEITVGWAVRKGEAQSIIIHEKLTDVNGKAGEKLACIAMPF